MCYLCFTQNLKRVGVIPPRIVVHKIYRCLLSYLYHWHCFPSQDSEVIMESAPGLHVADYVVFGAMLLVSLGIGVYYALSGGRQSTTDEYHMGNRKMSVLPVTLSYTVSFISTILLLGFPAEIYSFGAEIAMGSVGVMLGNLLAVFIFVPVLYPLKYTSINEARNTASWRHCIRSRVYPVCMNNENRLNLDYSTLNLMWGLHVGSTERIAFPGPLTIKPTKWMKIHKD